MPEVKMANNGWNGTFLPGDESLGFADQLEVLASAAEQGSLSGSEVARSLRLLAEPFRECYQPEQWRYRPMEASD